MRNKGRYSVLAAIFISIFVSACSGGGKLESPDQNNNQNFQQQSQVDLSKSIQALDPVSDSVKTPGDQFVCESQIDLSIYSLESMTLKVVALDDNNLVSQELDSVTDLPSDGFLQLSYLISASDIGRKLGCVLGLKASSGEYEEFLALGKTSVEASNDLELAVKSISLSPNLVKPGQSALCNFSLDTVGYEISSVNVNFLQYSTLGDLEKVLSSSELGVDEFSAPNVMVAYQVLKESSGKDIRCELEISFASGESVEVLSNKAKVLSPRPCVISNTQNALVVPDGGQSQPQQAALCYEEGPREILK